MKHVVQLVMLTALLAPTAFAQDVSRGELHLRRILAVPIGALPPMGMLMPASRNHNYWVGRLQGGMQRNSITGDLATVAAGVDLQWLGGSTIGLTGGYQRESCAGSTTCGDHALFGARGRLNLVTGGPTVAAIVGDNSATTTLGADLGYGYAPNAVGSRNACAVDVGLPLSLSIFQRVRVLSFFTPGIAWDVRCFTGGSAGTGASAVLGAGLGVQKFLHHGLDISAGVQRIVRRGSGIQLGVNATFVWLR